MDHLPAADDYRVAFEYETTSKMTGHTYGPVHVAAGVVTPVFMSLQPGNDVDRVPNCSELADELQWIICFP